MHRLTCTSLIAQTLTLARCGCRLRHAVSCGVIEQGGLEGKRDGLEDLDFYMGNDALKHSTTHQISYPIRHGLIEVRVYVFTRFFCLFSWNDTDTSVLCGPPPPLFLVTLIAGVVPSASS